MAEFDKNRVLWRIFAILALTGLVSGNKLDEILDDTELRKLEREDIPTMSRDVSETIITNPHVLPLPGRTLNDPYLPTQARYGTGVASFKRCC
ncbi:hypothetical protein OS493_022433 [Desmophyllum pertusum]|uniref:Uncharacterized protein n=1 Tax=Desmophyllum pertusum TaxID=174260 RepID=A0A9X0D2M5_9CNID|nr:hypothetical protein OS493_022433 [Desmophyllum pertusum]